MKDMITPEFDLRRKAIHVFLAAEKCQWVHKKTMIWKTILNTSQREPIRETYTS